MTKEGILQLKLFFLSVYYISQYSDREKTVLNFGPLTQGEKGEGKLCMLAQCLVQERGTDLWPCKTCPSKLNLV